MRTLLHSIIIASGCALASGVAQAQDPAPAAEEAAATSQQQRDLLDQVQKKYADVDAMRARFKQTSTSALYGESAQEGHLTLQRPKKMRWDFEGEGKQFITDGETMWIYSSADKQVIVYKDFGAAGGMAADALLQSLDKLEVLFDVKLLSSGADGHRFELAPLDEAAKAQVKRIELRLDAALQVDAVQVTDAFDGITTLDFSEVQLGGDVDPSTFSFTPPEGVTVVDASG